MIFQRGRYTTDQYRYHPSPNPTRLGRTVGGPRLLARWRVPVSSPRRISRTRRRKHVREFVGKDITKICMWIVIIYMDDDLYTKLYIYHILYIYHNIYIQYIYTIDIYLYCVYSMKSSSHASPGPSRLRSTSGWLSDRGHGPSGGWPVGWSSKWWITRI